MNGKNILLLLVLFVLSIANADAQKLPSKKKILKPLRLTNAYFMNKWPDPGKSIITNRERTSNIWTRGVYYEGLMARRARASDLSSMPRATGRRFSRSAA